MLVENISWQHAPTSSCSAAVVIARVVINLCWGTDGFSSNQDASGGHGALWRKADISTSPHVRGHGGAQSSRASNRRQQVLTPTTDRQGNVSRNSRQEGLESVGLGDVNLESPTSCLYTV